MFKAKRFADFINDETLEAYSDFGGIRIEENVLITPEGHRVLGKRRPLTAGEIVAVRKDHV